MQRVCTNCPWTFHSSFTEGCVVYRLVPAHLELAYGETYTRTAGRGLNAQSFRPRPLCLETNSPLEEDHHYDKESDR